MRCVPFASWLILTVLTLASMARASDVPVVSGMSYGVHQDRVRVILDISSEPGFAAFTLSDPDRLVIDLPELGGRKRLEALGKEVHALCAFDGL